MAVVFEKPKALTDAVFHYCPGCPHGIIHRLVAEAIDELVLKARQLVLHLWAAQSWPMTISPVI